MKALFSFTLILILSMTVQAQSFEILETKNVYQGAVGERITAQIPIKNLTNNPLQLIIKRVDKTIGTSQSNFICWDGNCLDSEINETPLSKKIEAKEITKEFTSELDAGLVPGVSTVKFLIYNRDNPSESVEYEVNYTIVEKEASKALFNNADLQLDEIYPNPVTKFAIISYELKNIDIQAKIVLHNVLGSIVEEYELLPYENKIKIITENMNPGVYFYTLYLDGDGISTHKLVIRK